ncbi:MAG: MogA/MoaB family molybdenum cofactor biosynthesis protein [Acidimicrobiia bacterium]|nr:MogA/MoaB family molybdenum cofactor biosynthesis protein [Acidimicrobiia bacterium]
MKALVVTVSDRVSRGEAEDRSGPAAAAALGALGFAAEIRVIPDGVDTVRTALRDAVQSGVGLVITTGGTGFAPRDLTPEGTSAVVDRPAPGLVEAMRAATFGVNPHGMLSRGVAGIAGRTLIDNLPGSDTGDEESLAVIAPALRHAIDLLQGSDGNHDPSGD